MRKTKIVVDRPRINSSSINERKDFNEILSNHQIMTKPFYKSAWYYGVGGFASIGLVAGSYYFLTHTDTKNNLGITEISTASAPPKTILAYNNDTKSIPKAQVELKKIETVEKTNTKSEKENIKIEKVKPIEINKSQPIEENIPNQTVTQDTKKEIRSFSFFDLQPRISGKVNGSISKSELYSEKGLVTNSDVEITAFELHLVSGSSPKVLESNSNMLTQDMKSAIEKISVGEEIYFENIKGKGHSGDVVSLSPIRYVLLN